MTFEEWWLSLPEDVRRMSSGCCVAASQSAWQAAWQAAQPNVEDLIRTCVPGGSICDPQQVADAIRDYFGVRDGV